MNELNDLKNSLDKFQKESEGSMNLFKLFRDQDAIDARNLHYDLSRAYFSPSFEQTEKTKISKAISFLSSSLILNHELIKDKLFKYISSYTTIEDSSIQYIKTEINYKIHEKYRVWYKLWLGKAYVLPQKIRDKLKSTLSLITNNHDERKIYIQSLNNDQSQINRLREQVNTLRSTLSTANQTIAEQICTIEQLTTALNNQQTQQNEPVSVEQMEQTLERNFNVDNSSEIAGHLYDPITLSLITEPYRLEGDSTNTFFEHSSLIRLLGNGIFITHPITRDKFTRTAMVDSSSEYQGEYQRVSVLINRELSGVTISTEERARNNSNNHSSSNSTLSTNRNLSPRNTPVTSLYRGQTHRQDTSFPATDQTNINAIIRTIIQ